MDKTSMKRLIKIIKRNAVGILIMMIPFTVLYYITKLLVEWIRAYDYNLGTAVGVFIATFILLLGGFVFFDLMFKEE